MDVVVVVAADRRVVAGLLLLSRKYGDCVNGR